MGPLDDHMADDFFIPNPPLLTIINGFDLRFFYVLSLSK